MTARCHPPAPAFVTQSEEHVWRQLREELPDEAVLLANVRLTNDDGDHELDLVVLLPDAGVFVIEVKGGGVSIDQDGRWWLRSKGEDVAVDPVEQALRGKYQLRTYIEDHPAWGRPKVRWSHAVVLPFTKLPHDFALPDLPRWMVHDQQDMPHLVGRLRHQATRQDTNRQVPTVDDVDKILELWRSHATVSPSVVSGASEREGVATDRLTQEQAMLLKVTRLLHRVEVRGGAGSGKTVLALTQAKQLTRGSAGEGRPAQRVALLCYSIGLAGFLERQVAQAPRRSQPAFVGGFHALGKQWGAPDGDRDDSEFWETELPALMLDLAQQLPEKEKFDSVVVDESQDFAESWWAPLLAALKDPDSGGLYLYSDENQRLFPRFGTPPIELVPLVLDHNLRNTKQIAETFGPLAPSRMRLLGGDGPAVMFVPGAAEDALDVADDQVDKLLDEGWEPHHIALITTQSRHPQQRELQQTRGDQGYWESFWDQEEVFYGTVLGCKGMERRAVVLCINSTDTDRARERLYVGMSRATDRLVVVGDPDWIREVGGGAVARALGL
ncbi:nuclease [Ornithinimicrobium ciconiae]|uniref:Nuclease n=1 Tax=Ornithinimicrobium ciconiae TaxID=2594265 RepID=A0A516G9M2_9MICO|nr:NERD domain-containing protein [Ornithinimicrobium ciconiae]QDO88227.1 nuclease [Ornithinimicrobium ciconiae]